VRFNLPPDTLQPKAVQSVGSGKFALATALTSEEERALIYDFHQASALGVFANLPSPAKVPAFGNFAVPIL
jgi:hypothetical protein